MKRTLTSLIASLLITFAAEADAELFPDSLMMDGHFFALPLPL